MKRLTLVSVLLFMLALLVSAAPSFAEKRGVKIEGTAATAYVAEQYGTSWAVVIGVNEYQHHPRVPKLQYAVNDAVAMERALLARGFRPEHIIKLLDRDATKNRIEKVLGDELRQKVGQNDRVLVFFAGHGKTDRTRSGEEEGYLMPVDGDPSNLFSTAISMSALRQISDRLVAKHILYVVDSCYSGYALFHRAITDDLLEEMVKKPAIQILTAGRQQDQAQERAGHGVFTDVLLRGLEGDAFPNKGWLSLQELGVYVQQRVYAESNKKQLPQFGNLSGEGQFVFVKGGVDAAKLERPSLPPPALSPPPPKDVDVSGYDELDQLAKLAEKREQTWAKVQAFAAQKNVTRETRVAKLDKFLQDFPDDNPHQGEVEALKQQIQQEIQVARARPYEAPRQTGREITGKDGSPMVLVPEGEFLYGDNNQRLSLSAFYMDKFEVSTKLYAKFIQDTSRAQPSDWSQQVALVGSGDRPVVNVTWHDAEAYCRQYGKRLPTEQEWEKAARGTDGRKYPWGNEEPSSRYALFNTKWNGYGTLATVESYEAGKSPYGLYHMAGNVWEWTSSDEGSSKVVRGGSWNNYASFLRSTLRSAGDPTHRHYYLGLRCAQDAS